MKTVTLAGLEFESLHLALIVESRFSLKHSVAETIRALGLFDEVIEARSINDAQPIIELRAVDCCVLGLGLAEAAAANFANQFRIEGFSKFCSYIKMTPKGDPLKDPKTFEASLEMPATKAQLVESLIVGVIRNSRRSPWHDTVAFSGMAEKDFLSTLKDDPNLKGEIAPIASQPTAPAPTGPEQLSRSGKRRIPFGPPLTKIIADLDDAKISQMGEDEVNELASLISKKIGIELPRSPSGADPAEGMKQFIKEWLIDRKTLSGYQAFRKLARRLEKR